ncbi:MAG: hypothetical protein KME46_17790 [Brasilonema angustatum HA4187-MV1]|nr:hypothetical protein [Brasilonema angustatum HA4187-MV1]
MSPALREGFQRQIPTEGNPPSVLAPPQATGVSAAEPKVLPDSRKAWR